MSCYIIIIVFRFEKYIITNRPTKPLYLFFIILSSSTTCTSDNNSNNRKLLKSKEKYILNQTRDPNK